MLPTGQGGGASHQRGNAFPTPAGRLYGFPTGESPVVKVFAAKGGIKNGAHKGAHLASAAVLYNYPGRSPEPACKAKPITGRTLGAQGRQARRRHEPSAPQGVNLREYSGAPNNSQRPIISNDTHSKKALTITVSAFFLISSFLSSRAASSQVLSAFVSLTTVFGMGTGVSSQLSPLNL